MVRSDDKYRARMAAIETVLSAIDYAGKDPAVARAPDPEIAGSPALWTDGSQ